MKLRKQHSSPLLQVFLSAMEQSPTLKCVCVCLILLLYPIFGGQTFSKSSILSMEGKIISQSSVVKVSFKLNDLSKHVSKSNLPVLSPFFLTKFSKSWILNIKSKIISKSRDLRYLWSQMAYFKLISLSLTSMAISTQSCRSFLHSLPPTTLGSIEMD